MNPACISDHSKGKDSPVTFRFKSPGYLAALSEVRRARENVAAAQLRIDTANDSKEWWIELNTKGPEMPTEAIDDGTARMDAMMKSDKSLTRAASNAAAWKPDLVAKSRNAPHGTVQAEQSISDRIGYIIDDATRRSSWIPLLEQWGSPHTRDQVIRRVRAVVWHSPEGQALKELDRALGSSPYTTASIATIRKSQDGVRFAKALGLLESGIPLHQ